MRLSDHLLKTLVGNGVQMCFGIAGAEAEAINISEDNGLRFYLTRHEFTAGVMGDVAGRLLGHPQLCWSTFGPGVTNMSTGACSAILDRSPVVFASAQVTQQEICFNRTHQCIDNVRLMEPITKKTCEIVTEVGLPQIISDLVQTTVEGLPGPVFLSVPLDVLQKEVGELEGGADTGGPRRPEPDRVPPALPDRLEALSDMIGQSRHPIIVVGNQVLREHAEEELLHFVDAGEIPVVCTLAAKGIVDEDHPYFLTAVNKYIDAIYGANVVEQIFSDVDLILLIGYDFGEDLKPSLWPPRIDVAVLNAREIESPDVFRPRLSCVGNLKHTLESLTRTVKPKRSYLRYAETLKPMLNARRATVPDGVTDVPRILNVISDRLGRSGFLCSDIGLHKQYAGILARTHLPNRFLCSNVCGSFGFGLPAALAAQICHPRERVIAICGDGGFHSASHDLETAARYQLPVVIIILNDCAFGLIAYYQRRTDYPSDRNMVSFGRVDFCKLAEANGVMATRVDDVEDLAGAIDAAFASGAPHLIEISTRYDPGFR